MAEREPNPLPWDDWVERVRAHDQKAARELVEALQPTVLPIVRGRLPRGVSEEDLAQEVFMKVFVRLDQYRREMPFNHWVARVAVNTCIDALRRQRRRREVRRADLSEGEEHVWETLLVDDRAERPGDQLAARDLVARLLESLPAKERLLIEWIDLEQRSMDEVAALTGWSKLILKVRLFRARSRLRGAFDQLEKKEHR